MLGAIALWCVGAAACRRVIEEVPTREVVHVDRPALDIRRVSENSDPSLIRIDDLYDSLEWKDTQPAPDQPQRSGWDAEALSKSWSVVRGDRASIVAGRLVFRAGRRTSLISQPALGIRFRSIRAIEIRMSVSKGKRMALWWSPGEDFAERSLSVQADLTPGADPQLYSVKASSLIGYEGLTLNRLRLVPTDADGAEVAVDSVRFVPREGFYGGLDHGLGREEIANESRHVIYARAPGSFSVRVPLPAHAVLGVGAGVLDAEPGVAFRVAVKDGGPAQTVIERELHQDERWEDVRADLSAWAGKKVRLRFSLASNRAGSIALWSNPTVWSASEVVTSGPNVIVYLIDTLRADHVGVYGARNATTPTIDALARNGALFEHASAQASWTRPSVASILTSLYPPEHGALDPGQGVSDGVITLAEQFRRYNYSTAAFSSSSHPGSSSNLTQGFDEFFEPPAILGSTSYVLGRLTRTDYTSRTGEAINRKLLPWIEHNVDRRFFVYVHATDPHAPYAPAAPYDRMFDTGYRGPIDGSYDPKTGFENAKTREEIAHLESLYDGGVRCVDDAVGEMMRALERFGLSNRTIVLVTSDHGEEFQEHGRFGHGQSLYEELLHVPLVLSLPASVPKGALVHGLRIARPVDSIDIFPTLCALAGIPAPPDVRGMSRASLLFSGQNAASSGAATVRPAAFHQEASTAGAPVLSFAWRRGRKREHISVSDGRYKLIHRPIEGDLLFDLVADPDETSDLLAREGGRAKSLSEAIERWWSGRRKITSSLDTGKVIIDQEERQWLEALGYVK